MQVQLMQLKEIKVKHGLGQALVAVQLPHNLHIVLKSPGGAAVAALRAVC